MGLTQFPTSLSTVSSLVSESLSKPCCLPQVCTGGAVCGEGWDIAALRVRQICPRDRCVSPLPLSMGILEAGERLRFVGAGMNPAAPTADG